MDFEDFASLLGRIVSLLFCAILFITLLHYYPLIGPGGVATYAVLLSLSWVLAWLGVRALKWIAKVPAKILIGFIALFLLLHLLLDEMTMISHLLLTVGLLLIALVLSLLWLQELRFWTTFYVKSERVVQTSMVTVVVLLSLLLYAFSVKEEKVIHQPQESTSPIRKLFYGSGHDKRRPEYADSVLLKCIA
jgi:hypothetical protein